MFWDEEITPEDEDEIIEWAARELYRYGMETAAILFLESYKPISRVGTSMGQIFFTPLLPLFGDNVILKGDKFFRIFQEAKNVERLIVRLEELAADGLPPPTEKERKAEDKEVKIDGEGKSVKEKKGWRRFIPF